ncbi:MAG TPA: protein phosphatase 2C domain-containing protein [Gemmatimonadales bacterium]|nr:protein phosphatase 2C domain-containing protein [Gemmatimonadales bacterium]
MGAPTSQQVAADLRKPLDEEIDVYGLTHPGKVRRSNQDHFLLASIHKRLNIWQTSLPALERIEGGEQRVAFLALVADGVGGGERGEEASRVTVEAITEYITHAMQCYYGADARADAFAGELQDAAMRTHMELLKRAEEQPQRRGMATTLTLFMGVWPWSYVLQVGDSRYYLFREGKLTQVTRDQTMAQDLGDQGVARTPEFEAQWGHILSSAIGGRTAAPVVTRLRSDWRNVHLMCSDGLTTHVPDSRIAERLASMTSAKQACEALLQDALDGGGTDNVTIIVGRTVKRQ